MALSIVRTSTPGFAYATTRVQTISAPAVGNSLIATIEHQATGTVSVADNTGNTWTRRLGSENGSPSPATGQFKVDIWDLIGITSGHAPTTVTVSDTGSASVLAISVIEVAGALTFSSAVANSIPTTVSGSSPTPAVTAAVGDLIVSTISYYDSTQAAIVASPYTLVTGSGTSTTRYDSAYWIATSAGTTSSYFTTAGSSFATGAVVARYTPTLSNVAPTAAFTTSTSNLLVSVDASGSTDSDGSIVSYDYDWGDSTTHGTTSVMSHTYSTAGTYTITLTVTDNSGAPTSIAHAVTVMAPSTFAPIRKGHKYNPGSSVSNTIINLDPTTPTSGSTIATGDWMIAVIASVTATTMTPPSGWTTLQALTQAGTLGTTIFGKIRLAGDTSYDFTMDGGGTTTCADLFWGSGGDVVANWIIGTNGLRSSTGTSTTNVAPSATSTADHSLGILVSTERTTATETSVSVAGATEWFFDQQGNSSTLLQTIEVASIDDKSPVGALGAVTVTYPNATASNGMARWIIIPPAPLAAPTRIAHAVAINAGGTSDLVLLPDAATVTGDSMLVLIGTNTSSQTIATPSGWTLLRGPVVTGNETSYAFAKIRAGGETSYNFSTTSGSGVVRGDVMTIRGADVITNWSIGTDGTRVASGGGALTTAPAITTTTVNSLILTLFTERSSATGTTATYTGATEWFFDLEGSDFITLAATYSLQPTSGTTPTVTATYSTTQATNGWGMQIGIPLAPSVPSLSAPTMKGHVYDNITSNTTQVVIGPDGSISTGDWMIAVFTTNGTTSITPATGWTTLLGLTAAGSGKIAVFGRIRASGDTAYEFPISNSASTSDIALMWGANAAAVANWITGASSIRGSSSVTNTAPSVTTAADNSLVLTISMDRNATLPTGISSISGATEWFFVPGTATVLQTIEIASTVKATAGATSAVTVTYPNASANGIAMQIVLPAATPPTASPPSAPIRFVSDFLATSLRVGAKIEDATTVRLVATPTGGGTAIISSSQTPSYFGWVNCKVTGLTPGAAYDLSLQAGPTNIEVATFSAIKTLAPTLSTFSMITSSCQSTGSNPVVFSQIASENPDFFAHQGDIHYEDTDVENVWRTGVDAAMSASYMKAMLATVPMTYHWDNHDWGGNSSYKTSPVATFAPTAIRELLGSDMPDSVGLYSTWVHHGIRFVETDQWALRDDATIADSSSKSMLGATQKAWFKATLSAAKEPIIIWLCSFPFYSNNIGNGRWGDFQTEQNELNAWFIAHPGVKSRLVAVGGDSHSICADDGTNSMWHIPSLNASPLAQSGGLASGSWNIANIDVNDAKGYYSKLTFTPTSTKVSFKWEAKQDDGTLMATWSKDFSRTVVSVWDGTTEHDAKPSTWNGTSELPGGIEFAP